MSKEIDFGLLGIPDRQIEKIKNHIKKSEKFVFPADLGQGNAFLWLKNQLHVLPESYRKALFDIAIRNKPKSDVSYAEVGYDSNQSHRKLSKVVGEAILLGGLVFEYGVVGQKVSVPDTKTMVGSELVLSEDEEEILPKIAKDFGATQDFLFPGVTPTDDTTQSLEEYIFNALSGNPKTSVRSVVGVGGVRFDRDWNYATDFSTFVNLKIKEDKRYYPGIGIYFYLLNSSEHFLSKAVKSVRKQEFQGLSVLCSAFVPTWAEMRHLQVVASYDGIELAEAFHSPAYEFSGLLSMFEKKDFSEADKFLAKLNNIWSFNSTIHLPWTAEFAGLSNDLIGHITNQKGDWGVKYGIGWNGKSLEVREYHFGKERDFPAGISGKTAYEILSYPDSDIFKGKCINNLFVPDSKTWQEVKNKGFLAVALEKLK